MKYVLLSLITISGCGIPEQGVEDVADCSMTDALGNGGESNGIKVHLEPEKTTYLVGEPVMFRVVLKNNTRKDIQAWVEALQNQVQIFLSDGKRFNRFEDGMQLAIKVLPSTEKIKPNGTKIYQFKVLYTASPKEPEKGKLAFPKPGTYCIQAKYPLFPDRKMFESNLAHITVKKPAGDDAKIWQKINRPSVLRFLQSGHSGEDEEDMPVELLDLVEQFPKSGYAEGLKHSLRSYYYSKASWLRDDPYMQKVRKLLDIDLKDPHLYPEDQRLEAKIQYDYPELTAIQKICDDLSEQSGVPLRVHPNLRIIRMSGIPRTEPLRKFMENSDGDSAKWIKDGDGYQLLPKPAIAEK